jgi:hypothetical protein
MKSLAASLAVLALLLATAAPASEKEITISGFIGVPGVVLQGLPSAPVTEPNGAYHVTVPIGFTGTVTPSQEGYQFEPPARKYTDIRADRRGDNFTATPRLVKIAGNVGAPGVLMRGLPTRIVSDEAGQYWTAVPYGWTGTITPDLPGYVFDPPSRSYGAITGDQTRENYLAQPRLYGLATQDVLVIPTKDIDTPEFAETAEDMRVMLQILREKVVSPRRRPNVLRDFGPIFGSGGWGTEAFYIQGHLVMFVMQVDFPLARPSEPNAVGNRAREQVDDPVWQQAREQLAEAGRADAPDAASPFNLNQFQENLIRALKHAANIRHLNLDDRVILTVIGSGRGVSVPPGNPYGGGPYGAGAYGADRGSGYGYTDSRGFGGIAFQAGGGRVMGTAGSAVPSAGSILTIQAQKADIDAFAKDQISFDQFNQRVKIFTY